MTNSCCAGVIFYKTDKRVSSCFETGILYRKGMVDMIENMYPISRSMEEIAGHCRKLPRNVRACGQGGGPFPVYIEDYVDTYIRRLTDSGFPECSAMVLVGQVMETEVGRTLFIRGGINANKICSGDRPVFGEEVWNEVYEKIRLHFPGDEVVGWCIAGPGFRLLHEDVFLRAHIDNFADGEKVFLCYESLEKELTMRICKDGGFLVLPGYYIYYEKNDEMQNYLLEETAFARNEKASSINVLETEEKREQKKRNPERNQKREADAAETMRTGSVKKDILQLAAIACIMILIVSVMMGTDSLSAIKEAVFAAEKNIEEEKLQVGEGMEDNTEEEEIHEEAENADEFAFGDFAFLEENEETPGQEREEFEEETAVNPEHVTEKDEESETEEQTEQENMVAEEDTVVHEEAEQEENPDVIEEETVTVLSPAEFESYLVKPGDTLAQICKEFYGSVELLHYLCELNQLKDVDSIYVGQELVLPKK